MQVLRKLLKREVDGNNETIHNERIVKDILTGEEINILINDFSDGEEAITVYGLCYDLNDELCMIDLDVLFEGLEEYIHEDEEPDENVVAILVKIEPYRSYTLYMEEDKNE